MKRLVLLITLFCLATQGVSAACYTPAQYKAEQAVRFHTDLMVVGLYCQRVMKQNTYATYQAFTSRNQNVIRSEENQLISYFKQTKAPAPEKALHKLRTDLANRTSLQASKSIVAFCTQYADSYKRAKTMVPADFQRWIQQVNVKQAGKTTQPICAAAQRSK